MYNIVSFGKKKENLEKAIECKTIGSTLSTFGESIKSGATIFLHCEGKIWGTAEVYGNYFESNEHIWDDKLYPRRFKIHNITLAREPIELSDGEINLKFREGYGNGWAYRFIFSPKPIPDEIANLILKKLAFE